MLHPPNSLRDFVNRPGGISVEEALAGAERRLDGIRDDCLAAIDAKIEKIVQLLNSEDGDRQAAYRLANEVFSESGVFGLVELSEAAHSLCALLCSCGERCEASLRVHVDALIALRRPDISNDENGRAAVLDGLRAIVSRYAAANDAA